PLGVPLAQYVSAFPAGRNATAMWGTALIEVRGMGAEFRVKGVNVALALMSEMAASAAPSFSTIILTSAEGRQAAAGRNWVGIGADPFLSGVATVATIIGIQSNDVITTVKHLYVNVNHPFVPRFDTSVNTKIAMSLTNKNTSAVAPRPRRSTRPISKTRRFINNE
ncbi:hypothetical protein B0H19DRAFT_945484, partial [Mycena capillaripes]